MKLEGSILVALFVLTTIVRGIQPQANGSCDRAVKRGKELKCGETLDQSSYIVGGSEARPGQFPFATSIETNEFSIGGALITSRHVLTCAHCIKNAKWATAKFGGVKFKEHREPCTQRIKSSRVCIHGKYTEKGQRNDIAIIELERDVEPVLREGGYGSVNPVCWKQAETSKHYGTITLAGWGMVEAPKTCKYIFDKLPGLLKYGDFKQLNHRRCLLDYPSESFCTFGTTDYTAAPGDSGSPYVVNQNGSKRWLQVGVQSTATFVGRTCKIYNNSIRLSNQQKWIEAVISKGKDCVEWPQ